jgi:hypothetical protein
MQGEPQAAGADDRRRYVGAYIIGLIEAGLVATGMQGFWVRAVVGLVFLAAVVFHLSMDQPQRLARLGQLFRCGGRLERQPAPPARGSLSLLNPADRGALGSLALKRPAQPRKAEYPLLRLPRPFATGADFRVTTLKSPGLCSCR